MNLDSREILIVDDETALLRLMNEYLERLGYAATPAPTMQQARAALEGRPDGYAVVVLDAGMAENGLDDVVIGLLAAHPRLRVVVSSGYPVDMSALQRAAPGRVDFLHKPFTSEMLVAALRRMLGPQEEEV